jgi:hypothetical protein
MPRFLILKRTTSPCLWIFVLFLVGCERDANEKLTVKERAFVMSLGILEDTEKIIMFDSQGGGFNPVLTSGNFFTDRRIASYWIDDRNKDKSEVHSAFYSEIDTLWRYPKYKSLTLSSYLEVRRRDGSTFNVYVSGDSIETWSFFNRAMREWSLRRKESK